MVVASADRILLVGDDRKLSRLVTEFLENNGYSVLTETRGDRAIERIMREAPDLVILDPMLPGLDGLSVCRRVRAQYQSPILMLAAGGDEADELAGLELGADDYISKPVRPQLLLARIRALLRRAHRFDANQRRLKLGPVVIDAGQRTVHLDGRPVEVTTAEFELLWLLARHAGQVLTRDQINFVLRGHEWDGLDRSIDLTISRLRRKLGDDGRNPGLIRSIRSAGYMWTLSQ
jgi:two-component system response regulator RstA